MAEAIDTAYVVVKPDTRAFGSDVRRQVGQQLRSQPVAAPRIAQPKQRDLIPRVGIRGAIPGLVGLGTTLTGLTGGVVGLTLAFKAGFDEIKEGQKVAAQTAAVIESTGGAANVSQRHLEEYADHLREITAQDDELIQSAGNMLLTFKEVRNEQGKGNAIFDRALKAALDLSQAGFGSVITNGKQLGKVLNDPVKGMTALSRAGVTFSAGQRETIKSLATSGHLLEAQKLILKEVESQVGGSAEAYRHTLPGAIDNLKNSFDKLMKGALIPIIPAITAGVEAVNSLFENLSSGTGTADDLGGLFEALKSAVVPLFRAIRSEGPRLKVIFGNLRDAFRDMLPILKIIGTIVGVVLVVAFKLWARQAVLVTGAYKKFTGFMKDVYLVVIDLILAATEKVLDATGKFASVVNKLSPGNPMGGVESGANAAKEAIIAARKELDALDGKKVKVNVEVRSENAPSFSPPKGGEVPRTSDTSKTVADIPGPREAKEQQLIAKIGVEQARGNVAAERALLVQLVAFYAESLRLAKERGVVRRDYQQKYEQAQADIRNIDQQAADDAKQAADDAKAAHDELIAAQDQERRDLLEFRIQIAAGTKRIIRDDKAAWAAYIAYLRERVRIAKAAGVGIAAARAELAKARQDAAQVVKDFIQAKFDEQEAFLTGQVTLFDTTGQESKLKAAYNRLIKFYRAMIKREGLTRIERQKYRIALAQTRKDLKELNEETGDTGKDGATFGQLAVDFLKNLHGFSSNLASNVMPRGTSTGVTEAFVRAGAAAKSAASAAATAGNLTAGQIKQEGAVTGVDRAGLLAPKGTSAAEQALADRAEAQGPATAAQFERLLSQNAAILRVLRRIAQDQDHPTAKFNRKQSPAAVVVGVS